MAVCISARDKVMGEAAGEGCLLIKFDIMDAWFVIVFCMDVSRC